MQQHRFAIGYWRLTVGYQNPCPESATSSATTSAIRNGCGKWRVRWKALACACNTQSLNVRWMESDWQNFKRSCSQSLRACLKTRVWVAQATGLCRPATRRTERVGRPYATLSGLFNPSSLSFRSASRRPERAGRPHYPLFKQALTWMKTKCCLSRSAQARAMPRWLLKQWDCLTKCARG